MKIELEKKYELTDHDYQIIKEKCEFVEEKEITDYYLDDQNFTLLKNQYYLRMRNGKYELKIHNFNSVNMLCKALEYDDENGIEQELKKYNLSIDDTTGLIVVITQRKKYSYESNGYNFIFDFDTYQYGSRYEIELLVEDDNGIDPNNLIEGVRQELGLIAGPSLDEGKVITSALHQNFPLYEMLIHHNI